MSLRTPSLRASRLIRPYLHTQQCLRLRSQSQFLIRPSSRHLSTPSKPPTNPLPPFTLPNGEPMNTKIPPSNLPAGHFPEPLDPITLHRLEEERINYYKRRSYFAAFGLVCTMIGIFLTAANIPMDHRPFQKPPSKPSSQHQMDSGRRADDPLVVLGRERKIIIQKLGEEPEERVDVVETGTSHVPYFPRVLEFYDDEREQEKIAIDGPGVTDSRLVEYQLVGLGIRTVSFLSIQVYVIGFYVATDDIALLQDALIKYVEPNASSLVKNEKEVLREKLFDPEEGSKIWSEILKGTGIRSLIRITPTRNTDFGHLRDAWVRSLMGRAKVDKEYNDEKFGESVQDLKRLFNRGNIPKGRELLMSRDRRGKLAIWYDDGKIGAQRLGQIVDERISRAVWLNYLGGKQVASEGARKSIVEGVMEFVERPVGTVAEQVV